MVLWSVVSLGFRPYRRPILAVFRFWLNGVGLARAFGPPSSSTSKPVGFLVISVSNFLLLQTHDCNYENKCPGPEKLFKIEIILKNGFSHNL